MEKPILYHWAPCATCAVAASFAAEHGIELDKRDVEQEGPYNELLALGGIYHRLWTGAAALDAPTV